MANMGVRAAVDHLMPAARLDLHDRRSIAIGLEHEAAHEDAQEYAQRTEADQRNGHRRGPSKARRVESHHYEPGRPYQRDADHEQTVPTALLRLHERRETFGEQAGIMAREPHADP